MILILFMSRSAAASATCFRPSTRCRSVVNEEWDQFRYGESTPGREMILILFGCRRSFLPNGKPPSLSTSSSTRRVPAHTPKRCVDSKSIEMNNVEVGGRIGDLLPSQHSATSHIAPRGSRSAARKLVRRLPRQVSLTVISSCVDSKSIEMNNVEVGGRIGDLLPSQHAMSLGREPTSHIAPRGSRSAARKLVRRLPRQVSLTVISSLGKTP
jgi:hypothetical protein